MAAVLTQNHFKKGKTKLSSFCNLWLNYKYSFPKICFELHYICSVPLRVNFVKATSSPPATSQTEPPTPMVLTPLQQECTSMNSFGWKVQIHLHPMMRENGINESSLSWANFWFCRWKVKMQIVALLCEFIKCDDIFQVCHNYLLLCCYTILLLLLLRLYATIDASIFC